ncbi:unnamed protein product [Urochloa humidicola]
MAPAAPVVLALGDDLLREVFVRLPTPADLIRAAAACKPFIRAARSAPFLRRFRRRHPSSCPHLLGCLLLPDPNRPSRRKLQLLTLSPPSSSSSAAASGGDFALSFLPGGGGGGAVWEFLDCRNGRFLLKNKGPRSSPSRTRSPAAASPSRRPLPAASSGTAYSPTTATPRCSAWSASRGTPPRASCARYSCSPASSPGLTSPGSTARPT